MNSQYLRLKVLILLDIESKTGLFRLDVMVRWIFYFCSLILFALACNKVDPISPVPTLEFVSLSKDTIIQGRQVNDSLTITLNFEDGDGDIGFDDNAANIFIRDSRDNFVKEYASPVIPISGAANGVSGEIRILITTLFNVCCIYDTGQDPCTPGTNQKFNELTYTIYIVDRAGNQSNEVTTSNIFLRCD